MSDSPVDQGRRTWVAITAGAGAVGAAAVAVPFVSSARCLGAVMSNTGWVQLPGGGGAQCIAQAVEHFG